MSVQNMQVYSRIVTLDPAATEILFKLGLGDRVVAVSHDSDSPSEARNRPIVSFSKLGRLEDSKEIDDRVKEFKKRGESLYEVSTDQLTSIRPDLIITQDLCGLCAVSTSDVESAIGRLSEKPEVYSMAPPRSLDDILEIILRLGTLTGVESKAMELVESLRGRIQRVRGLASTASSIPRVSCVEWLDPMEVSPSWMPEMIEYAHATLKPTRRDVEGSAVPWQILADAQPDVLIVSPCSFDTEETGREMEKLLTKFNWKQISAVGNGRAFMVDSDYLNRAGLRLVDGLEILARLIQPEIFNNIITVTEPIIRELS